MLSICWCWGHVRTVEESLTPQNKSKAATRTRLVQTGASGAFDLLVLETCENRGRKPHPVCSQGLTTMLVDLSLPVACIGQGSPPFTLL